ncbi:MAG: hypothetical protein COV91_00925 [Candidatus Taylorbacteria bacterium CG11_big_fil_rev_8_21_14_0_20_46_11]|uniref:HD/PDEase domain-containing protein n=1 Tax=Candidatus Taylorbacteria bacterium CG11_big_fil_rev_8_21_14_0_20_46_11 TaxID=1975025 RepID=A0A2H0KCT4_9BACT|nr:MAG: hypothetical protein COV91_00925 [Candidatus Taylorbacteria bacterium CG11_big_fil_rev_8_21_14_0_20_46_11]
MLLTKGTLIMSTKRLWERFPELTKAVLSDHIARGVYGGPHDFYHALMVAQYAELVAPDDDTAVLGWIAGLLHNVDRMYPKDEVHLVVSRLLTGVSHGISSGHFLVLQAVLGHSKKNDPKDDIVLVTLKDADRLGNIGWWHWLRAAQFRPNILPIDPRFVTSADPTDLDFRNPKTVLQDIRNTLEWEDWLRLPKAKKLGKPMFDAIRQLLSQLELQLSIVGLLPFPEELVVPVPK